MAAVAVHRSAPSAGQMGSSFPGLDLKVMNQKMTMQHTVRTKKLDERQLFKLINSIDGQKTRRISQIEKEVSEMTKDLAKLESDKETAKKQRIAKRAAMKDLGDINDVIKLDNSFINRRRSMVSIHRSTDFDAFAFRLKRERGTIKSPNKQRDLFRFDSRGNPKQDLSPVQSRGSTRELDCSEEDIAMMAWKEMKDFAAARAGNASDGESIADESRVPSRAATSVIDSVSIHSERTLDDNDDEIEEKPTVQENKNTKAGNDWSMILNAVVDGKLLAALRKEIANPGSVAPPATAPAKIMQPAIKQNVFIKSKWARIATAARDQSRQVKDAVAQPSVKNPFLKQVLALKKPATAPEPRRMPLRRKFIDRRELASSVLLGIPRQEEDTPDSVQIEIPVIKKEVSFADVESEDDVFVNGEEDGEPACGVPDCICHSSRYRHSSVPDRMDLSVDDYYDTLSRSYAASTGQPLISPVFRLRSRSSQDWSGVGRRSALPPPSPTPSEILEDITCTLDTNPMKMDYSDLDIINSVRRPMKGSNREMLLKEKEGNARITFQLMRQKMAENHPHDFNRNYGTPTPNWKILNPLKLRHKINQSSPLYTNWKI